MCGIFPHNLEVSSSSWGYPNSWMFDFIKIPSINIINGWWLGVPRFIPPFMETSRWKAIPILLTWKSHRKLGESGGTSSDPQSRRWSRHRHLAKNKLGQWGSSLDHVNARILKWNCWKSEKSNGNSLVILFDRKERRWFSVNFLRFTVFYCPSLCSIPGVIVNRLVEMDENAGRWYRYV